MVRSRFALIWSLAGLATLLTPALPAACGCSCADVRGVCEKPCCAAETPAQACQCQWDARHEQPRLPSRELAESFRHHDQVGAPTALETAVPPVLGVSREYLAASLAVPIRPPRILFGVWRN